MHALTHVAIPRSPHPWPLAFVPFAPLLLRCCSVVHVLPTRASYSVVHAGGENLFAAEVEGAVLSMGQGLLHASAFGSPDKIMGEVSL